MNLIKVTTNEITNESPLGVHLMNPVQHPLEEDQEVPVLLQQQPNKKLHSTNYTFKENKEKKIRKS